MKRYRLVGGRPRGRAFAWHARTGHGCVTFCSTVELRLTSEASQGWMLIRGSFHMARGLWQSSFFGKCYRRR